LKLASEVEAYLSKAWHALDVAEKLRATGEFGDATGKAY
jgi:hypothetical protein